MNNMNFEFLETDTFGKYTPEPVLKNTDSVLAMFVQIGKKFEPNFTIEGKWDKEFYLNLAYYFMDNENCKWDLSKGLLLHGKKGLGKSLCLKIVKRAYYFFNNHRALQIKKAFDFYGMESITKNADEIKVFYKACEGSLFIDEVMRETADDSKIINNFGTKEKPFSTAMHQMYRNFCDKGLLYHFTTNFWNLSSYPKGKLFANVYGNEIHDRLIEMCNVIEFKGDSKRR